MKKNLLKLVLLSLIVTIFISCTKNTLRKTNTLRWEKYTTDNGLLNNNIHSIAVDSSGDIWIGTDMGASSFNGTKWTNYAFGDTQVTTIAVASDNNIWFGTYGQGVEEYNGTKWIHYKHEQNLSNSIVDNRILSLAVDKQGNVWIGTDGMGVSMFNGVKWINYNTGNGLVNNHVHSITIDKQGNKWFGTDGGVSKFNDNNWTNYKNDKINGINSIIVDNQENVWVGGWGGLSEYNGTLWKYLTTGTGWLKAGALILSADVSAKGEVWVSTNGWGVSVFNGTNWITYKVANNTLIKPVYAIAIDKKGNKWFGTSNGLLKLEEKN